MCLWDLVDGKCREVAKLGYVHSSIQVYNNFTDIFVYFIP